MRYLGLDLGTKSVGVAISDRTNTIASALKVIRYNEETKDLMYQEILELIKKYNITHVVLGLPKNMNNSLGFASERSLAFKSALEKISDVKVELMDERLTTVLAQKVLLDADMSRKKRKKVVDEVAATIILNDYLQMRRK